MKFNGVKHSLKTVNEHMALIGIHVSKAFHIHKQDLYYTCEMSKVNGLN